MKALRNLIEWIFALIWSAVVSAFKLLFAVLVFEALINYLFVKR
jgi:hypothetical protein